MIVVRSKSIQRYLKIRRSLITTSYMSATTHSICVAEESVGISEFLSNAPPIRGILKQRYSDFIVREVNSDFEVVSLGSINGEALQSKYFSKSKAATTEDDISSFLKKISAMGLFKDALMEEGLREYLSKCLAKDDDVAVDFVCCPVALKDLRREVHTLIKQFLLSIVEADTVVVDAEQFIRFKAKCKVLKGKDGYRSEIWPSGLGNYLQFTLLKENVDTMSAVSIMSKYLRTKPNGIEFAGTKDKRAVTTQLCTIYRRKPSDFTRLNNLDFAPLIRAGDFKYVTEPLKLGDNSANRFEIVLREIASTDDVLEKTFQSIKQYGFVNYFGLQRFGKGAVQSHILGREIFFSNFTNFIKMMFEPRDGDKRDIAEAKNAFREGDYAAVLALLPNQMYGERCVAEWLQSHSNDFNGAFYKVPKNTRLICAHAYQSCIWNKAASARLRLFGLRCVEGDLVTLAPDAALDQPDDSFQKAGAVNHASIRLVSAEDIASNRFSVSDVILPLIGVNIMLPANKVGAYYEELLAADGLSIEYFKTKAPLEYRMGGAYRRLLQNPRDVEYKVIEYSDPDAELVSTEANRFRSDVAKPPALVAQDLRRALQVGFTLPPGSYATMLLREITKESTETEFHSSLTNAASVPRPLTVEVGVKRAREDERNGEMCRESI